ncbi:MBL fold metallo-hydrolase [Paenibacillus sp. FSL R10-2736]|uniref:MBL fold metallo-hydrolase n=1 Tax=Paenibacillus sp. FSL R10-2736 TaxID=2954692 RepID=UPI0030FA6120
MDINYNFTFQPVGQGLFYTGRVGDKNFVYDCGSNNKFQLEKCISNYGEINGAVNCIDLLIISHFHEDHVSGLKQLLDQVTVDTVVLPYIGDVEKVYLLARGGYGDTTSTFDLLFDPVRYFLGGKKPKARRVIFIAPGRANGPDDIEVVVPNDNNPSIDTNQMEEDKEVKATLKQDLFYDECFERDKLAVFKHNKPLILSSIWIFKFFNIKVSSDALKKFQRELKLILDFSDKTLLKRQLKEPRVRKIIATCYEESLNKRRGDFNDTSLVLFHAPLKQYNKTGIMSVVRDFRLLNIQRIDHRDRTINDAIGQLLLGDIKLSETNYSQFTRHFQYELQEILFILLPHHGSKHNWNRALLKDCVNAETFISSSGFSNTYGHPSIDVVDDIITCQQEFIGGSEFVEIWVSGWTSQN